MTMKVTDDMEKELKGWFDCLDAVAIEMEADRSFSVQTSLINVMADANITLQEVRWAQSQGYVTLDKGNVLNAYEGMLMEREEREDELE